MERGRAARGSGSGGRIEPGKRVPDLAFEFGVGGGATQRYGQGCQAGKAFLKGAGGVGVAASLLQDVAAEGEPGRGASGMGEHLVGARQGVVKTARIEEEFNGGNDEVGVWAEGFEAAVEPGEGVGELAGAGEELGGFEEVAGVGRCGEREGSGVMGNGFGWAVAQAEHAGVSEMNGGVGG